MNVVDSSGWIEYLTRGPNGPFFLPILRNTQNLIVPTIAIYEVYKRVLLSVGTEAALQITGVMSLAHPVELDRRLALDAAKISIDLKLAMADSIILATARAYHATLWTQDAHFKEIEGVRYIEKKA